MPMPFGNFGSLFSSGKLTPKEAYQKHCKLWLEFKVTRDDWFTDCRNILRKRFEICEAQLAPDLEVRVAFFQCAVASAAILDHRYLEPDYRREFTSELINEVCVKDFGAEATKRAMDQAANEPTGLEATAEILVRNAANTLLKS